MTKIEDPFSRELLLRLRAKFGRLPSAAFVAAQFNLRSRHVDPVSQESVRRWMRGATMPNHVHLMILVDWLSLDLNLIYQTRPHKALDEQRRTYEFFVLMRAEDKKLIADLVSMISAYRKGN